MGGNMQKYFHISTSNCVQYQGEVVRGVGAPQPPTLGLDKLLDYVSVCLRSFCVKWLLIVNQIIEVRGGRHRLLPASTPARGAYVEKIYWSFHDIDFLFLRLIRNSKANLYSKYVARGYRYAVRM